MSRMAKPSDRVFFAFCAAAGAGILLGSALPTFELYLSAAIGAEASQRSFDYHRDLHLLTHGELGGLVFPLSGAALRRRDRGSAEIWPVARRRGCRPDDPPLRPDREDR
jgi:hypothetical protein